MSDYIRKSRLKEISEIQKGDFNSVEGIRSWIDRQPTLDETEIIRKAFERVLERLREKGTWKSSICNDMIYSPMKKITVEKAIEIVKEECGINE